VSHPSNKVVIGGSNPSRLPHLGSQARAQTLVEPAAAPPRDKSLQTIPATIEIDTQGHRHQRHSSTPSLIIIRQDGKLSPSPCCRTTLLSLFRLDTNHAPWPLPDIENTQPIVEISLADDSSSRFSRSTSSTPPLRPRPASTSLRYA
jgi:hypothetical protein